MDYLKIYGLSFIGVGVLPLWFSYVHQKCFCRIGRKPNRSMLASRCWFSFQTLSRRQRRHLKQQLTRVFSSLPPKVPDNDEKFRTSDPPVLTWVEKKLPESWQPYARLARIDKPIGTMLLLWPCLWSTALAAPHGSFPDFTLLALFSTGSFIMRGAGCTINDLWDQDIDKKVRRTASRPLAGGEVTQSQALKFLLLQLSTGLCVLLSLPNMWYCFQWGAASLPLVVRHIGPRWFFFCLRFLTEYCRLHTPQ